MELGLRERVALFGDDPDPDTRADVVAVAHEIELHERFGDEYGYVFVVAGTDTKVPP